LKKKKVKIFKVYHGKEGEYHFEFYGENEVIK